MNSKECFSLCTASSDGHIALWPLNDILNPKAQSSRGDFNWQDRLSVHQSSIKSMVAIQLSDYSFLITTGGDDGAIGLTRVDHNSLNLASTGSSLLIPKAHAAAINAVEYVTTTVHGGKDPFHRLWFASSGNDQRLKIWEVTFSLGHPEIKNLTIEKKLDLHISIADLSSLASGVNEEGKQVLFAAGIGIESWAFHTP